MNTYFVADNKKRFCAIWQTDKNRDEVIEKLMFSTYDIMMTCDDIEHAQALKNKGAYELINIGDFTN